jgi:hypothetical protein
MTHLGDRARETIQTMAGNVAFRLRLLRMALRPMRNIPAAVVIALDVLDYDYSGDPEAVR